MKKIYVIIIVVVLLLAAVGTSYYLYNSKLAKVKNALSGDGVNNSISTNDASKTTDTAQSADAAKPENQNSTQNTADTTAKTALTNNAVTEYKFDGNTAKVGDAVAGMTITGIYGNNLCVSFKGQTTIKGTYLVEGADDFFGDRVMFIPDPWEKTKLPTLIGDARDQTFVMVDNIAQLKNIFGDIDTSGRATITIEDYYIDARPTETDNNAKFIKAVEVKRDR